MSVVQGDALTLPLADNSVDLIVTSPPYFALRSYKDDGEHYDGQIGSEPSPAEFLAALWAVTKECWRVLKPSGSLLVNLGDKSARSDPASYRRHTQPMDGGEGQLAAAAQSERTADHRPDWGGVRAKSLMGMPWRYAIGCIDGEADPEGKGWILRTGIVWDKPNGLPESVKDRVRRTHEDWFHFTKQPRYFSALDEIREPNDEPDRGKDWDERKEAGAPPRHGLEGPAAAHDSDFARNPLGRLPGSVWTIPSEPLLVPAELDLEEHYAAFPTEWPRRLILAFAPSGICTKCGEGRRPAVSVEHEKYRDSPSTGRPHRQTNDSVGGGFNVEGYVQTKTSAEIYGYYCACTPYKTVRRQGQSKGLQNKDPRHAAWDGAETGRREVTDRVYLFDGWDAPTTTPAVVLDPFGGTGTTALVARALGRTGVSVDMSAGYCRLAQWRIHHSGHDLKVIARTYGEPVAASVGSQRAAERAGQLGLFG